MKSLHTHTRQRFSLAHTILPLALALLALAPACSRAYAPASDSAEVHAASSSAALVVAPASLFERMRGAPLTVPHAGVRRLEYHYDIADKPHSLVYEERVTANGRGRFALDPLRVGQPAMTFAQRELFDLLQKNREGFFFQYRDFGLHQTSLFLANYNIVDLGTNPVVAGRACTELEIRRKDSARVTYRLAVDVETALVLRSIETGSNGQVTARSEFTDITFTPVLTGVDWFQPEFPARSLGADAHADATELRFSPIAPRLLPRGFQLLRSEVIHEAGNAWVRRAYSDGVETLFVLHRGPPVNTTSFVDAANRPTRGTNWDQASTTPRGVGGNTNGTYKVRLLEAGPWTLAEVARGEEQIFIVGKIGEDDVLRILQSSL